MFNCDLFHKQGGARGDALENAVCCLEILSGSNLG